MRRNALQFSTDHERRITALLFALYLVATQVGVVAAGAGTSNPGP